MFSFEVKGFSLYFAFKHPPPGDLACGHRVCGQVQLPGLDGPGLAHVQRRCAYYHWSHEGTFVKGIQLSVEYQIHQIKDVVRVF